ncbi:MAG: hypothetical protein JO235_25060 [Chroococcidiopsidaceae cyanobacterium CP_BM_RX_35]|nr:hypothetical protein [Chroococcidiopsidaceae cyanobacterium CP_BM_RX_35]
MWIVAEEWLPSDRFLDERLERYPHQFHEGNGKHAYTDIEAVHVTRFSETQCYCGQLRN